MSKAFPITLVLISLGVAPLVAQSVPTIPLGASTAAFADPFTMIGGVREVTGGKVIVVDPRDKVVQLIDLAHGNASPVGREGSGPGEFQFPRTVLALPNDETFVVDPMQTRFLRVDATGKVLETVSYPNGMGPGMNPVGADAQGRIYFEGSSFGGPGGQMTFGGPDDGAAARDSVPVIRWDRRTNRTDTLLMVKGPQMKVNVGGSSGARMVMIRQQPFTSRDAWGVTADGRVAVVRSNPYRVDMRAPAGTRASGPVVSSQALPITARDKDDFLKSQRAAPRMTRTVGGGGAAPPSLPDPKAEDYDWPATKPFFDAASVRMSPSGELWSLRSRASGDDVPVYDVFNAQGRLVRRVSFPVKTRLVGFGQGALYVARTDADDLQYLERYQDCGMNCDTRAVPVR